MDDADRYLLNRLLSEFAARLNELCRTQVIRYVCPLPRKVYSVANDGVEMGEGGLLLLTADHKELFVPFENIEARTFFRKHGVDLRIVPSWLLPTYDTSENR